LSDQQSSKARRDSSPAPKEVCHRSSMNPRALRGDIKLTLHTAVAVKLFRGRNSADHGVDIPGLFQFERYLETIANGSVNDDPFADWTLVEIEDRFAKAEDLLNKHRDDLVDQRRAAEEMGLTIGAPYSMDPLVVELRLRSPHAYIGARLIGKFDRILAPYLTLAHMGLLERFEVNGMAGGLSKVISHPFHYGRQYRLTGVTRADVREGTAKAYEAAEYFNDVLPIEILDGSRMPRFFMRPKESVAPAGKDPIATTDVPDQAQTLLDEPIEGEQVH